MMYIDHESMKNDYRFMIAYILSNSVPKKNFFFLLLILSCINGIGKKVIKNAQIKKYIFFFLKMNFALYLHI